MWFKFSFCERSNGISFLGFRDSWDFRVWLIAYQCYHILRSSLIFLLPMIRRDQILRRYGHRESNKYSMLVGQKTEISLFPKMDMTSKVRRKKNNSNLLFSCTQSVPFYKGNKKTNHQDRFSIRSKLGSNIYIWTLYGFYCQWLCRP